MTDTTQIAYTAEDLISHKLEREGFLVAKPKFDQDGADLLVLTNVRDGASFGRVQCKGRSVIKQNSFIEIPQKYVSDAFLVTLFIEDGNHDEANLFFFFSEDIKKWVLKKGIYRLSIDKNCYKETFLKYRFSPEKHPKKIRTLIEKTDVNKELQLLQPLMFSQSSSPATHVMYDQEKNTKTIFQSNAPSTQIVSKEIHVSNPDIDVQTTTNPSTGASSIDNIGLKP